MDVIRRSLTLAGIDPAEVGVRLRMAGGQVRPRFAQQPEPDDEVVEAEGLRVFVARSITEEHGFVEIAVAPEHEQLIVRPLPS